MVDREALRIAPFARSGTPVVWRRTCGLVGYEAAVSEMEAIADAIAARAAPEQVWLLEHPALYTAGTSAKPQDLKPQDSVSHGFPVHRTGRGGQYTYHGPGQRVAYVMLDLSRRQQDLRAFVAALERWLIATLAQLGVTAGGREDRVGVWVARPDKPALHGYTTEDKIAAIGIRVRRWVSFHGIALNVAPNLAHFAGIVPCGIAVPHYGVTSLRDLGLSATMADVDTHLRAAFVDVFGPIVT